MQCNYKRTPNQAEESVNSKTEHLKLSSKEEKNMKRNEESLHDLWDTTKWNNIMLLEA